MKILSINQEESQQPITNPVKKILEEGQKNVTDVDSLINLMRSPDLAIIGRSDLSVSHIKNYTQYWKMNNFNHSQNFNSTIGITSNLHVSDQNENSVYEDEILNNTKNHIHVGKFYGHSFKDIFNTIVSMKKLNEELELIEENSKITDKANNVLPHTDVQSNTNLSVRTESKLILLREFSGIIDFKISNKDSLYAAAGPPFSTNNGLVFIEPFQWSKSPINYLPHIGQSDIWNFNAVKTEWVWDSIT